MTNQPQHQR